jgi:electron transfer flavoprotein alpha/beta subunit
VKDIVAAKRKPVHVWPAADLAVTSAGRARLDTEVRDVTIPQRTTACEFLPGEPAEQVTALAQRLRELKLL